jgi:hypothetical protein
MPRNKCRALAHFTDDDPDNEAGLVDLGDGNVTESFTEDEIAALARAQGTEGRRPPCEPETPSNCTTGTR